MGALLQVEVAASRFRVFSTIAKDDFVHSNADLAAHGAEAKRVVATSRRSAT